MIKSLNLSMNGLSTNGALAVGDMLKQNESLTYLNISYNRIFDQGCAYLAKGLERNENLHHLIVNWRATLLHLTSHDLHEACMFQLHNNPITASGCLTLLTSLQKNVNTAIWKLDMHVSWSCFNSYMYCTIPQINFFIRRFLWLRNAWKFPTRSATNMATSSYVTQASSTRKSTSVSTT